MSSDDYGYWPAYVSVAERRKKAERELAKLRKKGYTAQPVQLAGRKLATTFWGKAWGENLESYSDFANRLPRGRTYARNGSVVDLQVNGGEIKAMVMGSQLYNVTVKVSALPRERWTSICKDCSGSIDSLVELLQGRLSQSVMQRVCQQQTGLFPAPSEIKLSCSCPDSAGMCKHVAAVLYCVGARLDAQPALVFKLRAVDEAELIAGAAVGGALGGALGAKTPVSAKVLDEGDLSALFGLEMESVGMPEPKITAKTKTKAEPALKAISGASKPKPVPAAKKATCDPPARTRVPAKKSPARTTASDKTVTARAPKARAK